MNLAAKVARRYREDGWRGLVSALSARLRPSPPTTDENAIIVELLKNSRGTMLDVGAAHGATLLPLARRGWTVHAFEPDSSNRARLQTRIEGLNTVTVNPVAVTEIDDQSLAFYSSPVSFGVSSLSPFTSEHVESETVRTIRLDTYLDRSGIKNVDYLKVDAEGHDLFVLRSFPFDRIKPQAVLCEFENNKTKPLGYDVLAMADYLVACGYSVIVSEWMPIERYGIAHKWLRFAAYPATPDDAGWGNLMAFRDADMFAAAKQVCGLD